MENIESKLIWGKDFYAYIKMCHSLCETQEKNNVIGINGPDGIGKCESIKKISKALDRICIEMNYQDIMDNAYVDIKNAIKEKTGESLLVYIKETPIIDYSYTSVVKSLLENIDDNKLGKGAIFVFSSETIIPSNVQINSDFRVFSYGCLSVNEKIQYSKQIIDKYKNQFNIFNVDISEEIIEFLIKYYTKEAGIRYLKVLLKTVFESVYYNKCIGNNEKSIVKIGKKMIMDIFGESHFCFNDQISKNNGAGIVMAYTKQGGIVIPIQLSIREGTGNTRIMGNVGMIMKDSIEIVFLYLVEHSQQWGIPNNYFKSKDFWISMYELALYKDGASAGLAFFIKLLCDIKKIKFNEPIAFSGEVALDGKVLRIGGLKEKIGAAKECGYSKFVLPKQAYFEYLRLPENLKENINTYFIEDVTELFEIIEEERVREYAEEIKM